MLFQKLTDDHGAFLGVYQCIMAIVEGNHYATIFTAVFDFGVRIYDLAIDE